MANLQFVYKPGSEKRGTAILFPSNRDVSSVVILGPNGQVLDRASSSGRSNGNRPTFRTSSLGSSYGPNIRVVATLSDGSTETYPIPNGSQRIVGSGPSSLRHDRGGPGDLSGGGASAGLIGSPGGNFGVIPGFADGGQLTFTPISPEEALEFGRNVGEQNREEFVQNFGLSNVLSDALLEQEAQGLEGFVPRTSELIRDQLREDNEFNIEQQPQFDDANRQRIQAANQFNIGQRLSALDETIPGIDSILQRGIERNERLAQEGLGDRSLLSDAEEAQLDLQQRGIAADQATFQGLGNTSTAARNLRDRLRIQERIALTREDRQFDAQQRQQGESNLSSFLDQAQRTLLPDLIEFNPEPVTPERSQVGRQIRATPTRDAATIAESLLGDLTGITAISPQAAFGAQLDSQRFNSQGIDALNAQRFAIEQDQLNAEAAGLQSALDQDAVDEERQFQTELFQQGLGQRESIANAGSFANIAGTVLTSVFGGANPIGSLLNGIGGLFGVDLGLGGAAGGASGGGGGILGGLLGGGGVSGSSAGISGGTGGFGSGGLLSGLFGEGAAGASGASGAAGGSGAAGAGLAGVGTSLAVALGAIGAGVGINEAVKGFQDGSITEADINRGINQSGVFNFANGSPGQNLNVSAQLAEGLNKFAGGPVNSNDLANAYMLSNPTTAPLAIAQIALGELGIDLGLGGGKSEEQRFRDALRGSLQDRGIIDEEFQLQLADGSRFNLGVDGNNKLQNVGENIDGKTERRYYDVDFSNPVAVEAIGFTNPLSVLLFGSGQGTKIAGNLVNAFTSNTGNIREVRQNAKNTAANAGLDYQTGVQFFDAMLDQGALSPELHAAYKNGWLDLMLG